jgi:hypothetical protein
VPLTDRLARREDVSHLRDTDNRRKADIVAELSGERVLAFEIKASSAATLLGRQRLGLDARPARRPVHRRRGVPYRPPRVFAWRPDHSPANQRHLGRTVTRDDRTKQERVREHILRDAPATFHLADIRTAMPGVRDRTIRLVLDN